MNAQQPDRAHNDGEDHLLPGAPEGAPMGNAGPYQVRGSLLGPLSGGAFGQILEATGPDGAPLVAKAARPSGGTGGTELSITTADGGELPIHVPALAFAWQPDRWQTRQLTGKELVGVLHREAEILERDGGVLLPRSHGLWTHEPSGTPVLVMERLEGRPVRTAHDIRAVLAALAAAAARGTLGFHGDLKYEHIFIGETGGVRLCDPAPRLEDPVLRAYTPLYNPRGWTGAAADVTACAVLLRYYCDDDPPAAWRWATAVLDHEPPTWISDHQAALAALDADLADPVAPPESWRPPPLDRDHERRGPAMSPTLPVGFFVEPPRAPTRPHATGPFVSVTLQRTTDMLEKLVADATATRDTVRNLGALDPTSTLRHISQLDRLDQLVAEIRASVAAAPAFTPLLTAPDPLPPPPPPAPPEAVALPGRRVDRSELPATPTAPVPDIRRHTIDSQTMSAAGGGGGTMRTATTNVTIDEVRAWLQVEQALVIERLLSADHGAEIEVAVEIGTGGWTVRSNRNGWRGMTSMSFWAWEPPEADAPPGIPPDTTFVILHSSGSIPLHH